MRKIFPFILFYSLFLTQAQDVDLFHKKANSFFSNNVTNGKVNYDKIHKNKKEIDVLIQLISKINLDDHSTVRKAFLINSYNIITIKQLIDLYPINSPMDDANFYKKEIYEINGRKMSLDHLENNILRKEFPDARLHFVLVCGANGCPKITNFAYSADYLDQHLDQQCSLAINDPNFIRFDSTSSDLNISEIFKWYEQDFITASGSVLKFIQSYSKKKISDQIKIKHYPYDWTINEFKEIPNTSLIQTYTPSVLLKKGQLDFQLYQNIYTQTAYRDQNAVYTEAQTRSTYYSAIFNFLTGVDDNGRINIGLDVNLKSVFIDPEKESPFKILTLKNTVNQRTTISTLGPKIKIAPLKKVKNFSIQSVFLIPVSDSLSTSTSQPWLDYESYTSWTQFFFDHSFKKFQLFLEADLLFRIPKENEYGSYSLTTPITSFISYFPNPKSTLFGMIQYAPSITQERTYYAQTGFGGKYQLSNSLGLELMYSNFFSSGIWGGTGETFNLGLRYIKR
jgi:hypothetical protein